VLYLIQSAKPDLDKHFIVKCPQANPLSPGEVLGCTSPKITDVDALMYVLTTQTSVEQKCLFRPSVL
jgi:2-(3-amino-3-carboxypropyl)histidine synthase